MQSRGPGSPIAHSKSPQLHLAAYRALGLDDWTYERIECTADAIARVVGGFGPEWVGVSVTMPGKFAALRFADERTERAELVGSANTLVRTNAGWLADNTDVDGVTGALGDGRAATSSCSGSGGTARAAVVAARQLGVQRRLGRRPRPRRRRRRCWRSARGGRRRCGGVGPGLPPRGRRRRRGQHHPRRRRRPPRRHVATRAGAARRDLRPVADAARRGRVATRAAG